MIMEPRRLHPFWKWLLFSGLTLYVVFGTHPASAVDVHTPEEVIVENGTIGILKCSFKSSEVVSSLATVTWTFRPTGSNVVPYSIFYYGNGKAFPSQQYKERVQFIGDLNKKDASIQLIQAHFDDNGTYFCDVKNPPDIDCTPSRTELKVVLKESLPPSNAAVIVGAVCGAVIGLIVIAVVTCLIIKRHQSRLDYTGCTSTESMSSHAPQRPKKVESSLESSRCSSPSGPLQGPVIYAQLDHSGSNLPNSIRKNEPVVYADIRKN